MTCVIIQWVFNLRPILVIGKRHHLAFIKVEGDAFSLFARPGSGRETCGAAAAPALDLAGRARGLGELDGCNMDPPGQDNLTQRAAGRAGPQGGCAPGRMRWFVRLLLPQLPRGWIKWLL